MAHPTTSVPTSAKTNSAIGSAQIGRFSDCRKVLKSSVGATATSHTAPKMPTSEVDHGSDERDQDRDDIGRLRPRGRVAPGRQRRCDG